MTYFDYTFNVGKKEITITADELISVVKSLNILFNDILSLVNKYASDNKKEDDIYYGRLYRLNFERFNKLYDSNILREIGESLYAF